MVPALAFLALKSLLLTFMTIKGGGTGRERPENLTKSEHSASLAKYRVQLLLFRIL